MTFRYFTFNFGTSGEVLEGSREDFLEDLKYTNLQRKFLYKIGEFLQR